MEKDRRESVEMVDQSIEVPGGQWLLMINHSFDASCQHLT